jgi:hypothetical protein
MDKEFLEDYEQRESSEYRALLESIVRDEFDLKRDRFPPDRRFLNIQRPVAVTSFGTMRADHIWAQIPFCGSVILALPPYEQRQFEEHVMKVSDIPKIIEFVKETGRLQVALSANPLAYEGLDHLDQFFIDLKPPFLSAFMLTDFAEEREIEREKVTFEALGNLGYFAYLRRRLTDFRHSSLNSLLTTQFGTFAALELGGYAIIEHIKNLMVDNPEEALYMLGLCGFFLIDPVLDLRSDSRNFAFDIISDATRLLGIYKPEKYFPYEIGRFLVSKLTYAAQDPEACRNLMDNYDAYDLQRVLKSLNDAILVNNPEIVVKSTTDLSDILENVWSDKTIPNRIANIEIGLPISIAAVGAVAGSLVAGPSAALGGGFLASLGFQVGEKAIDRLFNVKGKALSEKISKFGTKSYQATVYDFKKKYKGKITERR